MIFFRASLTLLAAAGLAATAQAQLAPGRSGKSTLSYMGREEAMNELAMFGRCYAKRSRDESLSLIATRPSSREEAQTDAKLFRSDNLLCLAPGTSMRMPLAYVRGAIAEGLLRAGTGVPAEYRQPAPTAAEVRNLSDAARCYVADHKSEARSLLETAVGSREEFDAVSKLMGGFEACLPDGVSIQFDATVIRFRLAEALLRLGPPATAAAGQ